MAPKAESAEVTMEEHLSTGVEADERPAPQRQAPGS
jgi:hypothetical protein